MQAVMKICLRLLALPLAFLPSLHASVIGTSKPAGWYASPEAQHIAQTILSFQTPAGGWSKNLDMTGKEHISPSRASK